MTDYTDEEIDRLAQRVEEKLRQKLVHQEIMTIRDDIQRDLASMMAKIDRCIEISGEIQGRNDTGEDAA